MTAETTDTTDRDQQGELDKEHAFANLDQTIGDREQAIEDVEQERLDDTQATIDRESETAVGDSASAAMWKPASRSWAAPSGQSASRVHGTCSTVPMLTRTLLR